MAETEVVYFRRSPGEPEDRLTLPVGTAPNHVRAEIITRIEPDEPEKHPHFYTWTWDVEIGGGLWEARYGWKRPDGKAHNLRPLFTHPAGG